MEGENEMNDWKAWLYTALGAFAGGAGGWIAIHFEDGAIPSNATQWKAAALGALIAGGVGFANWLRQSPLSPALPPAPEIPEQRL
jgi:hypothetical protein